MSLHGANTGDTGVGDRSGMSDDSRAASTTDNDTEPFMFAEDIIEAVGAGGGGKVTSLVCKSPYEIPLDVAWEVPRKRYMSRFTFF